MDLCRGFFFVCLAIQCLCQENSSLTGSQEETSELGEPNASPQLSDPNFPGTSDRDNDPYSRFNNPSYTDVNNPNYRTNSDPNNPQLNPNDPRLNTNLNPNYNPQDPRYNINANDPTNQRYNPLYNSNDPRFNTNVNDPNDPRYDPNSPLYDQDAPRLDPNNPNLPSDTNRYPNDPQFDRTNPNYNPFDPNNPNNPSYNPNNPSYNPNNPSYNPNNPSYNPNNPIFDPNNPTYDTSSPNYPNRPYNPEVQFGRGGPSLEHDSLIINEATYFIVASRMVRPGQIYKISAHIVRAKLTMTIRASISCNGVELTDVTQRVKEGIPETLNMRIPHTSVPGDYRLRVQGLYLDDPFGGKAFINETQLTFSSRFMTIFIQMDKPVYMQGQTVRFRTIPINTELKAFERSVDVYMLDPHRRIMKRWLSRQSNLGTVSLDYQLSDQPVFGEWIIQVQALGQVEESTFLVEEYYQTRFEVNVTMPAFFFNSDPYIYGRVMANYTSGAPVHGNLTLKATIRPIPQYRPQYYRQGQFNNRGQYGLATGYEATQYTRIRGSNYSPYGTNESAVYPSQYQPNQYDTSRIDEYQFGPQPERPILPGQPNQIDHPDWVYDRSKVVERLFNFDERYPFWMRKPDPYTYFQNEDYYRNGGQNPYGNTYNRQYTNTYNTAYNTGYKDGYNDQLPFLTFFNGTYEFRYPMRELEQLVPTLEGMEVIITATVGERYLDEVIEGYSIARIYNSSLKVAFLGGSPQVFKPSMPFDIYMAVSYHDGSVLPPWQASGVELSVNVDIQGRSGRSVPSLRPTLVPGHESVWHLTIDLVKLWGLENDPTAHEILSGVTGARIVAYLRATGLAGIATANADLLLLAHTSPKNHHIHVSTSTADAKVGEYIIFHVRTNFYLETFNYLVMSKGIILVTSQEIMQEGIKTFALAVSAEMAPVATIVVWSSDRRSNVLADSLTFPVNGISRNNFTVYVNNRKARTGEKVEVAIFGEPGAYVGLSAIDNAFYTMQAGNELSYAKVITKMARFDEETNGTFAFTWHSHLGIPDELVYFPSHTFGIDANRTFEYAGLIVLTDVPVPRRLEFCNRTLGYGECLDGRCYSLNKQCDGINDCSDGTDETNCYSDKAYALAHFRKFRFNRIQRQYDNVWLWKDVNIGPHGRYVFTVDVPPRPAHWTLSAFGVSPKRGLGMLRHPISYVGVLPFFITVEGPDRCRQGEQMGLRVAVFNYQPNAIEAVVVLAGSPDYKFVHVEENGIVRSYNPRTSHGEHQFFAYIPAGDAATIYLPVVPARLGVIHIHIHASTLIGKHSFTKEVLVEADGLPQYRHHSVLLDLSNRAFTFQYMHVNVTENPEISYEVDRYYVYGSNRARVSVVGDVVGPVFPTMPVNATSLLHLPMDSAEQNMFSFAANMYTTLLMRLINQRNRTLEKDSFHHMNILYQRQLSFMKPDGSFSLFRSDWNQSDSSVWVTSFCARTFQDASFYEWENYIYIDPEVISMAVSWILEHQTQEGSFYEVTWLPDRNDNTSVNWPNDPVAQRNITLTAHVVITLETVKNLKDIGTRAGLTAAVSQSQQKAIMWLERNLRLLEERGDPYSIAVTAYALALSRAASAEQAYTVLKRHSRQEGGLVYWGIESVPAPPSKIENQKPFLLPRLPYKYDSSNVAATAYALLTSTIHQDQALEPIVQWINAQRLTDGGWASTQDTYIALKALIEYTTRRRLRDVSALSVTIEAVAIPGKTHRLVVDNTNIARLQSLEIPHAWGTVKVQARGAGYAVLQMSVQYNVDIARFQTAPPVRAFSLMSRANFFGRNQSHVEYQTCSRWTYLDESERSGLAVLEVPVPTGYMIQQQKLDAYVLSRRVRNLQRAKYTPQKVFFYFDYLDTVDTCVNFTLERWFPVANMSRYLPVRVYDYYAPERFNETIFDALNTYLLNICEVCGSSQCPYCPIYSSAIRPVLSILVIVSLVVFNYART